MIAFEQHNIMYFSLFNWNLTMRFFEGCGLGDGRLKLDFMWLCGDLALFAFASHFARHWLEAYEIKKFIFRFSSKWKEC